MGSLTLRIISEESHTSSADGTIFAPTAAYSSSLIAEPTPAPCCTKTSWPWSTRAFTPAGVAATRNSLFLTSVGIPTFMRMSFFLDDSPPTTLSAILTTVATVTTRVHGCVGTHLFKSRPRHGAAEIVVTGRPRMPHPASSRPHDSRSQHMRPPPCPGSPLSKDHVPAGTGPSLEPHGPKARRLTICNSSPRAPRRLSTAVVAHDL